MCEKILSYVKNWILTHRYCAAMLYIPCYLVTFFLMDGAFEPKYIIHCGLDDLIPFNEYFVVIYMLWFPSIMLVLLALMLVSERDFKRLAFTMFTGMTISLIIYGILPTGLLLRPQIEDTNFFRHVMLIVWGVDEAVNVCPSIHCSSSSATALVLACSPFCRRYPKVSAAVILFMLLIIVSTVFVKQHSVIDVVCGVGLTCLLFAIALLWEKRQADR